jgi:hypothetical protein
MGWSWILVSKGDSLDLLRNSDVHGVNGLQELR